MMRRLNILLTWLVLTFIAPFSLSAATVTWTGSINSSWNIAGNWDSGVPTSGDTAVFTSVGVTSGMTISLDANQSIDQLVIATTTDFTIGAGSDVGIYTLSMINLDRQDVAGTEGNHTLAAAIVLMGDGLWTVNGSGYVQSTSAVGISGAYNLSKNGTGELRIGVNAYTGSTTVLEGSLKPTANGAIKGHIVVGSVSGNQSAIFLPTSGSFNDVMASKNVTVYQNGNFSIYNNDHISNLVVVEGIVNLSYMYVDGTIYMTGGTLNVTGSVYGNKSSFISYASSNIATVEGGSFDVYGYGNTTFNVADGPAYIDVKFSPTLRPGFANGTNYTVSKTGAGLMVLNAAAGGTYGASKTIVSNGTLLVTNTSGSATGLNPVQVNGGATLGGNGIIGGSASAGGENANITLAGTNASSVATLSPGGINALTGEHTLGTLTVGSVTQSNNVTFNNFSRLQIQFDEQFQHDTLAIYGSLDLSSSASDNLVLTVPNRKIGGSYTIVSASSNITGIFDLVSGLPTGAYLHYSETSIEMVLPPRGSVIFIQ